MVEPIGEPSDEEILERVSKGDVAAFELVMRRYNRRLFRAVRAILKDDAEVEDVIQEAYVSAYAHLADFSGRARFSTWLTRIAVHEAFGRLRKRRRSESWDVNNGEEEQIMTPTPSPEKHASDGELRKLLEQVVETLPETFRTVFVLRAVEQLSVAETSEVLGNSGRHRQDAAPSGARALAEPSSGTRGRPRPGALRFPGSPVRRHRGPRSPTAENPLLSPALLSRAAREKGCSPRAPDWW